MSANAPRVRFARMAAPGSQLADERELEPPPLVPRCRPGGPLTAECLAPVSGAPPLARREGERCACGGTIGPDGMCDRCRARAQAGLSRSAVLALQRGAGNRAVAALIARNGVAPKPSSAAAGKLQRSDGPWEGERAGCGLCSEPAAAGLVAHVMVQSKMGHLGIDSELKVAAGHGAGTRGRLDLGRWNEQLVEIGEIKPGDEEGFARGKQDLAFYEDIIKKSQDAKFKDKEVRRLNEPAPAEQVFPNEGVALPEQQKLKVKLDSGVYGYWCEPSSEHYFRSAVATKAGSKHVTKAALEAKAAFFNSDCIKRKTKQRPAQEKRVRIKDRAGATRFATVPQAIAILQSRAYHVRRDLENLAGEHKLVHEQWKKTLLQGLLAPNPFTAGGALAAVWTGMPDLAIWAPAQAAAAKTQTAAELEPLAKALDELERAVVSPRFEYLAWKARRDGTPPPTDGHTPAPAAGATAPPAAAPPIPPPSAQHGQAGGAGAGGAAKAEGGGLTAFEIAALAALVVVTFLILQPEVGAVAVAGAVGAEGAAGAAGAAAAVEGAVLADAAAVAAEATMEAAALELAAEPVVGAVAAL
jgi:hypothetical protein